MVTDGASRWAMGGLLVRWWMVATLFLAATASAQIIGEDGPGQLNILFAIEGGAIFVVVVGIFFIWNRLLGVCTGYILRKLLWKSSCIWISIDSIQFSPLAGKILFKNLRYHSSNMSIRVLKGHVTWRYWKWIVREEGSSDKQPCRCSVNLEGLEWFLYNRTPAFDAIVTRMQNAAAAAAAKQPRMSAENAQSASSQSPVVKDGFDIQQTVTLDDVLDLRPRWRMPWKRRGDKQRAKEQTNEDRAAEIQELHRQVTNATTSGASIATDRPLTPPVPNETKLREKRGSADVGGQNPTTQSWQWQRDVFPIEIIVSTGAIVIGSDATPTVTIAEFQYAKGFYQTAECRSKWDLYRQVADFRMSEVKVLVRTNPDYTGTLLDHGKKAYEELIKQDSTFLVLDPAIFTPRAAFLAIARKFTFLASPYFSKPPTFGAGYYGPDLEWRGLARYRTDEPGLSATAPNTDYAKVTTLLVTSELEISYYTDVPGVVPKRKDRAQGYIHGAADLGNGDIPPEWGVDCVVHGGTLTYGPWADRQRAAFMKAFLPSIFYHSSPTESLRPGETRMHTAMRVLVELRDDTVLRMPTREASKDWMYSDGSKVDKVQRKYGWLDVVVGPNSTIRYDMPIVALEHGYNSIMQMHLDQLSVRSSVNYEPFLHAKSCRLFAQMPAPLQWDARRDWVFDLSMDHPTLRVLRDHVTLIGDLAKDWSTGPTGDFHHFVPFDYQFNVTLTNYDMKLYLNDFNIIDSPQADEANSFLIINGPRLVANVEIPAIRFRPESSTIPFSIDADSLHIGMTVPIWHTHHIFAKETAKTLATIKAVHVRGTYLYYSSFAPDHIETLNLIVQVEEPRIYLFGWAVRRLLLLRDNYLGNYTGYRTVSEFMESFNRSPPEWGDPVERKYRPNKSDTFEVNLDVAVTEGLVILPNGLYDFEQGVALKIPSLDVHLRSHEASLELVVKAAPIGVQAVEDAASAFRTCRTSLSGALARSELRLDGLDIRAHRLFGPAPRTSTYLCLWEIGLDRIVGSVSPALVGITSGASSAFGYLYADEANAPLLVYQPPLDADMTFVNVNVTAIDIETSRGPSPRIRCVMQKGLHFASSSAATRRTTSRQRVVVPRLEIHALMQENPKITRRYAAVGLVRTSLVLDILKRESQCQDKAKAQLEFVKTQDKRTHRIGALYQSGSIAASRQGPYSLPISIARGASPVEFELADCLEWTVESARSENEESPSSESDEAPPELPFSDSALLAAPIDDNAPQLALPAELLPYIDRYTLMAERFANRYLKAIGEKYESESSPKAVRDDGTDSSRARATDALATGNQPKTYYKLDLGRATTIRITPQGVAAAMAIKSGFEARPNSGLDSIDQAIVAQRKSFRARRQTDAPAIAMDITGAGLTFTAVQSSLRAEAPKQGFVPTILLSRLLIGQFQGRSASAPDQPSHDMAASLRNITLSTGSRFTSQLAESTKPGTDPVSASQEHAQIALGELQISLVHPNSSRGLVTARVTGLDVVGEPLLARLWPCVETWTEQISAIKTPLPAAPLAAVLGKAFGAELSRIGDPPFLVMSYPTLQAPFVASGPGTGYDSLRDDPGWKVLHRTRRVMPSADHRPLPSLASRDESDAGLSRDKVVDGIMAWRGYEFDRGDIERLGFLPPQQGAREGGSANQSSDHVLPVDVSVVLDAVKIGIARQGGILLQPLRLGHLALGLSERQSDDIQDDMHVTIGVALRNLDILADEGLLDALLLVQTYLPRQFRGSEPPQAGPRRNAHPPTLVRTLHLVGSAHLEMLRLVAGADSLHASILLQEAAPLVHAILAPSVSATVPGIDDRNLAGYDIAHSSINVSGTCSALRLAVVGGTDSRLQHADPLLYIDFNGISYILSAGGPDTGAFLKPRLALRLRELRIGSSQTPPILWARIENWHKSNRSHLRQQLQTLYGPAPSTHKEDGRPSHIATLPSLAPLSGEFDAEISGCGIDIQVADAVTAFWTLSPTMLHAKMTLDREARWDAEAGIGLGAQVIGFSKAESRQLYGSTQRRVDGDALIRIPEVSIDLTSQMDGKQVLLKGAAVIERFEGVFKPSVLDRLLSIYKAIGSEARTMMELSAGFRQPSHVPQVPLEEHERRNRQSLRRKYLVDIMSKGVRVTLVASQGSSAFAIEADAISGGVAMKEDQSGNYDVDWTAQVTALQVSLGHIAPSSSTDKPRYNRLNVSSYMLVDLACRQASIPRLPGEKESIALQAHMRNIHCVMQIAALSEVSDLISSWTADLDTLRERRLNEWNEVVAGTERLMRQDKGRRITDTSSIRYIDKLLLEVTLHSIAIALPMRMGSTSGPDHALEEVFPAMLFSIAEIAAVNSLGQSGRMDMSNLLVQFVPVFDRTRKKHFEGLQHASGNRMHLPLASIRARYDSGSTCRDLWISGTFEDFEMRIDADIVTYCRLLAKIYAQGKARIDRLAQETSLDGSTSLLAGGASGSETPAVVLPREDKQMLVRVALHFRSGIVQLGGSVGAHQRKHTLHLDGRPAKADDQDSLKLPGVALWVQYQTGNMPSATMMVSDSQHPELDVGLVIEASSNILRPSIVSFIDGVISNARAGAIDHHSPDMVEDPTTAAPSHARGAEGQDSSTIGAAPHRVEPPMNNVVIRFSLRIDQSRLTLICAPDSEVMAELAWETGGLTIQKVPGLVHLAISGSISDVAVNVRHAFLSNQDSLYGSLHGLTASAMIPFGRDTPLQIIIDTSLEARAKLGRIQDLLCLKAVWVDRLSRWNADKAEVKPDPSRSTAAGDRAQRPADASAALQRLPRLPQRPKRILVRAKTFTIGVDLALTRMTLRIEPIVLRANVDHDDTGQKVGHVDLVLNDIGFKSEGILAGKITNRRIAILSHRAARTLQTQLGSEMMRLTIEADDLVIVVDHEGQGVVRLELQPCVIGLHDNWRVGPSPSEDDTQTVDLNFQITLGTIDAVLCVFALPALLDTAERIYGIWERQVETARSESAAYRAYLRRRPADSATAVAKVLQDRVNRGDISAVAGCALSIAQDMGLTTSKSRLALYMGNLEDNTAYLMESAEMKFSLDRDRPDETHKHRNFRGKLTGTRLRRWTARSQSEQSITASSAKAMVDGIMKGTAIKVINLPDTVLAMKSVHSMPDNVLSYDYDIDYRDALTVEFQMGVFVEIQGAWRIFQDMRSSKLATASIVPKPSAGPASRSGDYGSIDDTKSLVYKAKKVKLALPGMNVVGDTANDILAPYTGKYTAQAPQATHEFMILPMEKGMDILLHIYQEMLRD